MKLAAFVALFFVLAAPTYAGTAASARRTGVLHGAVTRGPSCSNGQAHPCPEPLANVQIDFVRGDRVVKQTTTGADGTYRIRLRAGAYGIRVPAHVRWTPTQVRVLRGQIRRVDISIDAPGP